MTLTTIERAIDNTMRFQMPVRSMTLTTTTCANYKIDVFQMPVRSMTLTTKTHMFPLPL